MNTELRAAALGDSAMWGQGLRDEDKYDINAVQQIATLLGRTAKPLIKTAHSGVPIVAGRNENEQRKQREEFVDRYPEFFTGGPGADGKTTQQKFIEENDQTVTLRLHPELPSTFPTVSFQVKFIQDAIAADIELLLLNGGLDDLDFQVFLNPEDHRGNFVEHYDPILREIFFVRTRSLLSQARKKFPNAVIMLMGYFTPFMEDVAHGAVKDLFEHESGKPGWEIGLNDILHIKDVDQLVREAQVRAQYGLGRALYWARRVVSEINEDRVARGPGIIFVHPQFGPDNVAFGSNPFLHSEYEFNKVKDAAKQVREAACPRFNRASVYQELFRISTFPFGETVLEKAAKNALEVLEGPTSLLDALRKAASDPGDRKNIDVIVQKCKSELGRINEVRRASFLHPNEKGAQRYAAVTAKRFNERHHHIQLRNDLTQLIKPTGPLQTRSLQNSLRRYGLGPRISLRAFTQLMLVDSIRLEVVTANDSDKDMPDDIFLDMGMGNRWRLNFPTRVESVPRQVLIKIHPHFEPGSVDDFMIDARSLHLGSLTQFTLERVVNPSIAFAQTWKPASVKLHINGKEVFSSTVSTTVSRGGKLTFPYPG